MELYTKQAPITANHFLQLVKDGVYDGGTFYRTVRGTSDQNNVPISVVQGGVQGKTDLSEIEAIEHETTEQTGIHHLDGMISMARSKPGTARTEFFICVGDQPELDFHGLRNPDGQGFAAFGKVIEGDRKVYDIWRGMAAGETLNPPVYIHKIILK